jgi:predicted Zn finger-like uncharacterized protein
MFTRCPECRTVFYITAAELKAADGTVICGACDTTFDALEALSETRPLANDWEEDTGESGPAVELEPLPGEIARDEEEFLEEVESLIQVEEFGDDFPDPDSVFRLDELPDDTVEPEPLAHSGFNIQLLPAEEGVEVDVAAAADEVEANDSSPAGSAGDRLQIPPKALLQDASEPESFPELEPRRARGPFWLRLALAVAAVLLLTGTWAHTQRGQLLRHPAAEAVIAPVYALLGIAAVPDWQPEQFRVLRSEAVADPGRPGNLRVAVEFRNGADFAQPYPVIRVVLQDRFGQRVGSRDFAPDEYLESGQTGTRMPAGERLQAAVTVADPGGRADGFRVSLCLAIESQGLVCAQETLR